MVEHNSARAKRVLADLSADEIARLRLLNDKLIDAERWIHQRAQQCISAYYAAGGKKKHRIDSSSYEDVEIEAKVTCVLREDHPEFSHDDNIVAELDASTLFIEPFEEGFSFSEFGAAGNMPPLSEIRLCWLFHDLVDHVVHRDWNKALDVGGLWIDVKLAQQLMVSW
jgi:hypothetical protein